MITQNFLDNKLKLSNLEAEDWYVNYVKVLWFMQHRTITILKQNDRINKFLLFTQVWFKEKNINFF